MPAKSTIKRVVFVQKFVPHYRLPLFELLKTKLAEHGIEFVLIYGRPDPFEGSKIKMMFPDWGRKVKSLIIPLPGRYVYWQGSPFHVRKNDVVIVEHASKLLDNYILFLLEQLGIIHMCYFGHGRNFQDKHELRIAKAIKKLMLKRITRWFAYTSMSVDSLIEQGVAPEKIVSINNTLIHNTKLSEEKVPLDTNQCIYIGGLYHDKRINFLLESSQLIFEKNPNFTLHIVGTGPQADIVKAFSVDHPWCIYHDEVYGEDRDRLLFQSSAILMPGLVGLVAVDSFHFACPIMTTNCGQHSPEVAYLSHNENSLTLPDEGTPQQYASMVIEYLSNDSLRETIMAGCRASANTYTIDNTADHFVSGILSIK